MAISLSSVIALYYSGAPITHHTARAAFDADCRLPAEAGGVINPFEWELRAEVSPAFGVRSSVTDETLQQVYLTARDRARAMASSGSMSADECRAATGLLKATYQRAGVRVSPLLLLLPLSLLTPSFPTDCPSLRPHAKCTGDRRSAPFGDRR